MKPPPSDAHLERNLLGAVLVRYIRRKYWEGLPQKNCSRCYGKGWYYREWSDDATGRSMKRQKQPCDKCEARTNEPIDYDTVELIT